MKFNRKPGVLHQERNNPVHQHVPRTDQLETSFVEKDLHVLEEELNMSQKLASLSYFLPFFSWLLFLILCSMCVLFYSLSETYCSNLSSSWQICRLYSGCLCFQEGCNIVLSPLPSFREDFQAWDFSQHPFPHCCCLRLGGLLDVGCSAGNVFGGFFPSLITCGFNIFGLFFRTCFSAASKPRSSGMRWAPRRA